MQVLVSAASAVVITALGVFASSVPVVRPFPPPISSVAVGSAPIGSAGTWTAGTGAAGAKPHTIASSVVFAWPLSPQPAIIRRFDQPHDQWSAGHRGVDLLAAAGQPVLSAGEGVVAFSGVIAGRGVLTVRHSDGLRTTYEPVDERVAAGTLVHRGSQIGVLSAVPGHCPPRQCLHWGVISGETYRDPLSLMGFGRPVLLPLG